MNIKYSHSWTAISSVLFAVQFCGQAPGSEGQLYEAPAGGHNDQDGGARKGVHEEQATSN